MSGQNVQRPLDALGKSMLKSYKMEKLLED